MKEPQRISLSFNREVKKTAHEIRVREKQERVTQFTNQYFERNFNRFHAKAVSTLMKKSSPEPSLQPNGMQQDHTADMNRTAAQMVKQDHQMKLSEINKVAQRMISGKSRDNGLER